MTTRTRSWWGWGNVEDAVSGEEGAVLVARVAAPTSASYAAPPETPCSARPATREGTSSGERPITGNVIPAPTDILNPRRLIDPVGRLPAAASG
ncbi:hypothetical protein ACOCJ7_09575 [Knoellia sp. CPCC 206453]|uniref:hypothetical protein n=1 Tax=Knoellia pratensis TaxID=3404796 RepID=UPI0036230B38